MASKNTFKKKSAKEKKNSETKKEKVSGKFKLKDSNATPEGVKFRVTFLVGQFFRGRYYQKSESIVLSEKDAKAYSARTTLKIEKVE